MALSAQGIDLVEGWRPGAIGAVAAMHSVYYAREWGFGVYFEAKVARELAEFAGRYDPARDLLLLAMDGERIVGSMVVDGGEAGAERHGAHLRWFIIGDASRGAGAGRRLMDAAMDFLRARHARAYLTTFAGLDAARALYERVGFRLVGESEADSWGTRVREQRFEWTCGSAGSVRS
jgi:ribosomal protein S18 acetylase RimI-like enzyme